jgi:hypothetical protein
MSQTRRLGALVRAAAILALSLCYSSCVSLDGNTSTGNAVDLDVLYVGAHPDDEASSLSTLGQLTADHRLRAGVMTITRGEGGGTTPIPRTRQDKPGSAGRRGVGYRATS